MSVDWLTDCLSVYSEEREFFSCAAEPEPKPEPKKAQKNDSKWKNHSNHININITTCVS